MGTRSGSIDPAIMEFIAKKENLDIAGVMDVLNKNPVCTECPTFPAICGSEDAAAEGNVDAKNAREVSDNGHCKICRRICCSYEWRGMQSCLQQVSVRTTTLYVRTYALYL